MRKILRKLLPCRSRDNLDEAVLELRAAADKLDAQSPKVKARTGRFFIEAAGPHIDPKVSTATG